MTNLHSLFLFRFSKFHISSHIILPAIIFLQDLSLQNVHKQFIDGNPSKLHCKSFSPLLFFKLIGYLLVVYDGGHCNSDWILSLLQAGVSEGSTSLKFMASTRLSFHISAPCSPSQALTMACSWFGWWQPAHHRRQRRFLISTTMSLPITTRGINEAVPLSLSCWLSAQACFTHKLKENLSSSHRGSKATTPLPFWFTSSPSHHSSKNSSPTPHGCLVLCFL